MSDQIEPTFDVEAAKKVIENEKLDRSRRVARKVEALLQEERVRIQGITNQRQDGLVEIGIAFIALD